MSIKNAGDWLLSQNSFTTKDKYKIPSEVFFQKKLKGRGKTISITSGKGGVGKTSIATKMAKQLASEDYKILLIDCDYNLSNTYLKLGIPINDNFSLFINGEIDFDSCLYKDGKFHLLSGSNGSLDLFENKIPLDKIIFNILLEKEKEYDFIFLDSPAGLNKETMALNAYSDFRFVVVTPDKSSITDSYSLIKILNNKYGVNENHLLLNKISNDRQYKRIVKTMSETVENFLNCRLNLLGFIGHYEKDVDQFDRILLNENKSKIHGDFCKVLARFTENFRDTFEDKGETANFNGRNDFEQDVQSYI